MDARLVLKKAMDVAEDDKLHYGVSAQHVQAMFKLIVKMHEKKAGQWCTGGSEKKEIIP